MRRMALGAIALLLPFAAGVASLFASQRRASANSAPANWEGSQSAGALLAGDACPIAVEKELLTVNVPEFPAIGGDKAAFEGYNARVTAKYTFRNPTESDYTATLLFPFGRVPDYAPAACDFYGDTSRYTVTENGSAVAVRTRHSYDGAHVDFDVEEGISLLTGADDDRFFCAETPVTTHTFHVTVPEADGEHENFPALCFKLKADPAKTRIAASLPSSCFIENGFAVVSYGFAQTRGNFDFSLYVFGEDVTLKKQGVYGNRVEGVLMEGASVEETAKTTGNYSSFVAERYPGAGLGMSEADWQRGFTEAMEIKMYMTGGMMCSMVPDEIDAADFMRWYEYDLDFPAGEAVVNEVTAPIYPTVRGRKTHEYDYTYLLSPARKWASFGSLRVEINTPYYLTKSSLDFEKTEGGYVLDWEDGLPLGELTFTLSETEPSATSNFTPFGNGPDTITVVLIILGVLVVVAAAVTITCVAVHRKKAAPSARRGGTAEGTIDLPPSEGAPDPASAPDRSTAAPTSSEHNLPPSDDDPRHP